MISKEHILGEIRRLADENGGQALGRRAFEARSGLRTSDWLGKYWARWGDALVEAGFDRNEFTPRLEDASVLRAFASFCRDLGRIPVNAELRMRGRGDESFPSHTVFSRLGTKQELVARVSEYCRAAGAWDDVVALCDEYVSRKPVSPPKSKSNDSTSDGYVYLIRSGRHYKIGMTRDIHRRAREVLIELPERSETIHVIRTDDPSGIEAYWHNRFASKRGNGEWFELNGDDVRAFRRRKFM